MDIKEPVIKREEILCPIEVGNLFVLGLSRFAKYLVGGDLLFDGGMVSTY